MAEDTSQPEERTEPASARKKEKARKKGQVVRSMELNTAVLLVFGLLVLYVSGGMIAQQLSSVAREVFTNASQFEFSQSAVHHVMAQGFMAIGIIVAPVSIALMIVGLLSNLAQVGFHISVEAMEPKWGKLNPLKGVKNLFFSRRSTVELAKSILKIGVVASVAYLALDSILDDAIHLVDADLEAIVGFMVKGAFSVGLKAGVAMLVLAVFDYAFQRFEHERNLRMTKQEVKEEFKMLEGDPLVKGRIKSIQRQIAYKRMMADVPKADVVVTNPTHLALALKYDSAKMGAPRLVAKGADLIAQKIKEIAIQHNVPLVEDKPLAQAIYKSVDVGEEIPEKLFQAVAQVLAYIYRLRDSKNLRYATR